MWRDRLFVGLAIGVSLFTVGCGGGGTDDPAAILADFQNDASAASQRHKGKTVRLRVEKVSGAEKVGPALEYVNVQGQFKKSGVTINATVDDPAEQQKALALKAGEPVILEGEVGGVLGETKGMGVILMKSAKVVP